jgi:hypothetical protein
VEIRHWTFDHGDPVGPLRHSAQAMFTPWLTPDDLDDAMVVVSRDWGATPTPQGKVVWARLDVVEARTGTVIG